MPSSLATGDPNRPAETPERISPQTLRGDKTAQETAAVELRFIFVELLFAMAIAEVATKVATLTTQGVKELYPYTHILLATLLIASSWIGWKNSAAKGNKSPVKEIFGLGFLVLLLDVVLVIFYFILVRTAEEPENHVLRPPSAREETLWTLFILLGYLAWDVLTKAFPRSGNERFLRRCFSGGEGELWERGWVTLICILLAVMIWGLFGEASKATVVTLTDVSLIFLVLLFRALKEWLNKEAHTNGWVSIICAALLAATLVVAARLSQ
jgi:hypothetical protein